MKKIFNDIDDWLSKKDAWPFVVFLTIAIIGLLLDHFFADHALYPEFLKDWSPFAKGWSIIIIIASPVFIYLFIYFLFVEIIKSWKNRDKY